LGCDIFFPFEIGLNFLIKACLFLPFKNVFKNNKKNYFFLQIKIFIFFPPEIFFKIKAKVL